MSGARGTVRKVFDAVPQTISNDGDYDGSTTSTTGWANGIFSTATSPNAWVTANWLSSAADNGRVGLSVAVESLDLRIKVTPQDTVVGRKTLRLILCADNECDGTGPLITELLGDTANAATTVLTGLELSFLQPAFFGRFNILMDEVITWYCSSTSNSFTSEHNGSQGHHERHFDMKGHRIMWDVSDASAIANARKGHIFMFGIYSNQVTNAGGLPNNGAATTLTTADPPIVQYTARMRYTDQ